MIGLLLFGSGLEREIGSRLFWRLFLVGGALAGLGWVAFGWIEPLVVAWLSGWFPRLAAGFRPEISGVCVGASGGVFALIGSYAALFPRREVVLLLFFVVPIRMRASRLAWVLVAITIGEAILFSGRIAYAAHLAGCLAGYFYAMRLRRELEV